MAITVVDVIVQMEYILLLLLYDWRANKAFIYYYTVVSIQYSTQRSFARFTSLCTTTKQDKTKKKGNYLYRWKIEMRNNDQKNCAFYLYER